MDAKVHLQHVSLLQHHLVSGVGRVVRRAVVDTQPAGEAHASQKVVPLLETRVAGQGTNAVLDGLRDLDQRLAGLDELLRILADLAVNLGSLAVLLQEVVVHPVEVALLLVGCAVRILVLVLDNLAFGELVVGEEGGDGDPWRFGLLLRASLLLLRLALLLFLRRCQGEKKSIHISILSRTDLRSSQQVNNPPPAAPPSGASFSSSLSSSESSFSAFPFAEGPVAGAFTLALPFSPFTKKTWDILSVT